MARENITFPVNLRQNVNTSSTAYGKYFPEVDTVEALSTKGFAKHVAEHGKLCSFDLMQLVIFNIVGCLKEMVAHGQPVKLDGLGTFYPTVESVKDGAPSVEKALELGPDTLIAGVHIRFLPEGAENEELTSRQFKKQCSFTFAYLVKSVKKTIDGKTRTYQDKTPLADWAVRTAEADSSTGGNGGSNGDSPVPGDGD